METDGDLKALEAAPLTKAAAAVTCAAGVTTVLGALQMVTSLWFRDAWRTALGWSDVACGVVLFAIGIGLLRNRAGAALAGVVVVPLGTLVTIGWVAMLATVPAFGCLSPIAVFISLAASILVPLTIGPTRKASALRKKLADQGIDLGL